MVVDQTKPLPDCLALIVRAVRIEHKWGHGD